MARAIVKNGKKDYFSNSILLSLLIQVPIFLVLYFITFEIISPGEEIIELEFISPEVPVLEEGAAPPVTSASRPLPQQQEDKVVDESGGKLVELPKRRMIEDDLEAVPVRFSRKLPVMDRPGPVEKLSTSSDWSDRLLYIPDRPQSPKPTPYHLLKEHDELPEAEWADDVGHEASKEAFFELEGSISERGIIHKIIPEYPAGLQKEARIRLRFYVLPNGRVGQIIPLTKADARLESVSIEALRGWRFAPVPGKATDVQEGIITFIYKLR